MTVNLSPVGGVAAQFFDNNGVPLTGGKLYTYVAGTTTPQATYTTSAGSIAHANPIILDSAGRVPGGEIWLTAFQVYKFSLFTSASVLIGTYNNVTGINGTGIATDAASVSYTSAGTGAVATTVQARLRQTVSVKDFGATGDGVTDDTAAINAAIAYLTSVPPDSALGGTPAAPVGGTVFFPNGSYVITSTVKVHACMTLQSSVINPKGQGENQYYGATIVNNVASAPCILLYRGGASIEGFRFVKNFASAFEHIRCISEFNRVRYCAFETCKSPIKILNQDVAVDPVGVEIDNCEFFHLDAIWPNAAIYISGATAGNARITNNNFNLDGGISGYPGTTAIKTDQAYFYNLYIVGNNFFNASYDGVTVYPLVDLHSAGSFIAFNTFGPPQPTMPANYYGLTIEGYDNVITGNGFGTWGGINIIAGSTNNQIGPMAKSGVTNPVLDNGTLTDIFDQQAIAFTPVLSFTSSSAGLTYTSTGVYTKIRNVATVSYYINVSSMGSASGNVSISLPFLASSSQPVSVSAGVVDYNNMAGIGSGGVWCKVTNSNTIAFLQTGSATNSARLTQANFTASSVLEFTITYLTV